MKLLILQNKNSLYIINYSLTAKKIPARDISALLIFAYLKACHTLLTRVPVVSPFEYGSLQLILDSDNLIKCVVCALTDAIHNHSYHQPQPFWCSNRKTLTTDVLLCQDC